MGKLIHFFAILVGLVVLNSCAHFTSEKTGIQVSATKEAPKELLLPKYQKLLKEHPAKSNPLPWCKVPKVNLNKKTNIYRKAIKNEFEEAGKRPNFCGSYFLMATPITGEGDIFIFECRTGKPLVYRSDKTDVDPLMDSKSCAFVVNPPHEDHAVPDPSLKERPRLHRFDGLKLLPLEDAIWPKR